MGEGLITFKGGYVHGNVPLLTVGSNSLTGDHSGAHPDAPSITVHELTAGESITGTFLLQYQSDATTQSIQASASSVQMRTAIEALSTVRTVSVSRSYSWQELPGTVSVTHGSHLVATSGDMTGSISPGDLVMIDGETFRVSIVPSTLSSAGFSLIDAVSGVSANFLGVSGSGIKAYTWGNGYKWAITFQMTKGSTPDVSVPLTIGMHSLGPAASAEVRVLG